MKPSEVTCTPASPHGSVLCRLYIVVVANAESSHHASVIHYFCCCRHSLLFLQCCEVDLNVVQGNEFRIGERIWASGCNYCGLDKCYTNQVIIIIIIIIIVQLKIAFFWFCNNDSWYLVDLHTSIHSQHLFLSLFYSCKSPGTYWYLHQSPGLWICFYKGNTLSEHLSVFIVSFDCYVVVRPLTLCRQKSTMDSWAWWNLWWGHCSQVYSLRARRRASEI